MKTAAFCFAVLGVAIQSTVALYVHTDTSKFWPEGMVPVCWKPGIDPNGVYPLAIRRQVEDAWMSYARISFIGWENCPSNTVQDMPDGHIVFIEQTSGTASSDIGRMFGPISNGNPPRPTQMFLRFGGSWLCDTFPGGYTPQQCAAWTAVHEFGHALGFLHEQARPDFGRCRLWDWAWRWGEGGGREVTAYDGSSTMNYCSDGAGTNKGRLTLRDIVGVQQIYGRKPPGTFNWRGRVLDVHNVNLTNGSHVQFWHSWGGLNQAWKYSPSEGTSGQSVNSACTSAYIWQFTAQNMFKRKGTNMCLDFAPGNAGSRGRLAACNPNSFTQRFFLKSGGNIITNGRCLTVVDSGPISPRGDKLFIIRTGSISLQDCDPAFGLQQVFSLGSVLRGSAGNCLNGPAATPSRDGMRALVGACNANTKADLEFDFGDVDFTL